MILAQSLDGKVASWQVPENWAFIEEVPKTTVGKFDKKVLRARYQAGELDVKRTVTERWCSCRPPGPNSLTGEVWRCSGGWELRLSRTLIAVSWSATSSSADSGPGGTHTR